MKISETFGASYFKAEDFDAKGKSLTIVSVENEEVGDETKPVIRFEGEDKGLSLNKTNALAMVDLFGDETDEWVGKTIKIVRSSTMYQGKRVACMRVSSGSSSRS